MKIVGKYSFIKRDKNNNVISKKQQYNTITNLGQKQILDLLLYSTPVNNFKGMIGYDVLDLSTYKIKPVFSNGDTKIVKQNYINQLVSDDYSDQNPTLDKWENREWTVQSSFFFDKKWGGNTFKLNKVFDCTAMSNYDYSFSWRNFIKRDSFSKQDVDAILNKDHKTYVNWGGYYSPNNYDALFYQNIQNIDFFRVYCRQRVIVFKSSQQIDLWKGRIQGESWNDELKVVYKKDLSQTYNSGNFCFRAKYRAYGSTGQFTYFTNSTDIIISDTKGTVTLASPVFPSIKNQQQGIEVILQYYVHYKDEQLKNGICGMYLDYNFVQKNNQNYFSKRSFFGNGIFSSNGGKSWDNYMCFPWAGTPKTYGKCYYLSFNNNNSWFSSGGLDTYNSPSLLTTSQKQDGINQHYYSFYPYVYKNPTNFCFLTFFKDQIIKIQNFLFLVPKFKPQVPRAFVFGNGNQYQQSQEDVKLQNECLKLDATQCQTTSENGIIKWKTLLDFEQANDFTINQVGLVFGNQNLKQVKGNWYCLKNIVKQDCNSLFSRVRLQTPIQKTDQQALQVIYELVVS